MSLALFVFVPAAGAARGPYRMNLAAARAFAAGLAAASSSRAAVAWGQVQPCIG